MSSYDYSEFRFGIEHEFPAVDGAGQFVDFSTASFEDLDRVIQELPAHPEDATSLRTGDLGIKAKRWYIEGFERFDEGGTYIRTDPKGFEIRTPICDSLPAAIDNLNESIALWDDVAGKFGYSSLACALNPFRDEYVPEPPLNAWELADRDTPEEQTAHIHMLTYGPDISFSHPGFIAAQTVDIARKLTYYSPFIVPFSFTSPFHKGEVWGGQSRRTFYRTGQRPAVLVFTEDTSLIEPTFPTLVEKARIPAEVGRIEFKAFDCVPAVGMYRALGTLLVGIALDETLPGRATVPDGDMHRLSATESFGSEEIHAGALEVLAAARAALPESEGRYLAPLEGMLSTRMTFAQTMVRTFNKEISTGSDRAAAIMKAIR